MFPQPFKLAHDDDDDQRRQRSPDSGVASPVAGSNTAADNTAAAETVNLLSAAAADLHISEDTTANGVADDGLVKSPEPGLGSEGGDNYAAESALSDSGQGSEPDDSIVMAYHFMMPGLLCGKYKLLFGVSFNLK